MQDDKNMLKRGEVKHVLVFSKQFKRRSLNSNKELGNVSRNKSITMFVQHERLLMCTQNLQYETHVQAMDSQLKLCHDQ